MITKPTRPQEMEMIQPGPPPRGPIMRLTLSTGPQRFRAKRLFCLPGQARRFHRSSDTWFAHGRRPSFRPHPRLR